MNGDFPVLFPRIYFFCFQFWGTLDPWNSFTEAASIQLLLLHQFPHGCLWLEKVFLTSVDGKVLEGSYQAWPRPCLPSFIITWAQYVYLSAWMALPKWPRLGGLGNRHLFLIILVTGSPKSGGSVVGFWWEPSSWLADDLLAVSLPGTQIAGSLASLHRRIILSCAPHPHSLFWITS